jgi:hypothetical protein
VAAIFQGKSVTSIAATMRVGLIQVLDLHESLLAAVGSDHRNWVLKHPFKLRQRSGPFSPIRY